VTAVGRQIAGRTEGFGHLLAPGRIGGLELPNRVVMPAMDMNLCVDGSVTDAEIDHYAARSAGGVGLVITGTGAVSWPIGAASMHQPGFSDDRHIAGMARLADAVHAQGGRVAMQLCHHGKVSTIDMANDRPLLVPSVPVPAMDLSSLGDCTMDELMGLASASGAKTPTYRQATDDDLYEVIDAFSAAARRVKAAGIDAIEIHAAHGYLLSTFLSPGYNHRTDQWGGSIEGRARLTCEVVRAVRAEVGDDYPVLVRINGHEFGPDHGITVHTAAAQAVAIAAAGADAIHVSANAHDPFANFTAGPLPDTVAAYRAVSATIKRALMAAGHDVPVIAVGRLLPEVADDMVASGHCDFVSMGRQLLADPDLVARLADGRRAEVRPCINCYVCVEQNFFDLTPRCAVNARLGRGELDGLGRTDVPRSVLVIGGGPAGMEAARVAALRGHDVTLMEASDRLGGTMRFSALTTPDNEPMVHWLVKAVTDAGVDVHLATRATPAQVTDVNPDVVVVATGARRTLGTLAGAATTDGVPRVHTGDDLRALLEGGTSAVADPPFGRPTRLAIGIGRRLGLLSSASLVRALSRRWLPLGRRVVVIGGGLVGLELAGFLAERNRQVALIDSGSQMGLPMALPRRWSAVRHASSHGIALVRDTTVEGLVPGGVAVRRGDRTAIMPADDVVVAEGVVADTALAESLAAAGFEVCVIGDATGIGYIEGAVHSGFDVGMAL
jgi:2,4-dienoyl-CoA reductase-like NADH-dependent reductase (Old Yellow Enzyme family)